MAIQSKGARFERDICKRLSLWVTGAELVDVFWRASMSGGRETLREKNTGRRNLSGSGDIVAITPEGHPLMQIFSVECKFIRDPKWATVIAGGKGTKSDLHGFWQQAVRQSVGDVCPLLLMRQNFMPELAFTSALGWAVLHKASFGKLKRVVSLHKVWGGPAHAFHLSDLFLHVRHDHLIKTWKEWPSQ